ncbi:AAA family ATPase [Polaromonas sp. AET17H-212]|uniref:AAA family ATPase n=1 Tax=Polaromonas sp. AET17H-212 TaxID=1977061 RepID=UPI000BBCE21E|nr:AAA family ATPase [Polaromonas sp. AET17H-212]
MNLLAEILKWSEESLTLWQRDAARRLFQQQCLEELDYDQLMAMMKAANDVPNSPAIPPVPLAALHLPAKTEGETVLITALRDMKNVNRLAPGQTLSFSRKGISVVYGGNGSGKSGYSRVLKKACRARDLSDQVLVDATDVTVQKAIPEATFDIESDGVKSTINWKRGSPPSDKLSNIAVFDAKCARVYLTAEQAVAYLPYGLDVVESLANKCLPKMAERLAAEIGAVNTDVKPFAHLLGDTAVGRAIAALGPKTLPIEIEKLASLTEHELTNLTKAVAALNETDPKTKAKEQRLQVQRLDGLVKRIDAAAMWVATPSIEKLKTLDESAVVALNAEKMAAEVFRAGETLLPGTGDPIWSALLDSARRYSTEVAYPDHAFPHTDGGVCVLCQQELKDGAARLERFENFVKQDAARTATEKRHAVSEAIRKVTAADVSFHIDDALNAELSGFDPALALRMANFEACLESRRKAMLAAVAVHDWTSIPDHSEDPREQLKKISAEKLAGAEALDKAGDAENRKSLEAERNELLARQALALSVPSILELIERFKLKDALENCKKDLKTKAISDKSKELASNAVTKALKVALDEEFLALGIGHIKTKLLERNDKGVMKYRLLLDLPIANNIEEILSEGEQRAIAIGSFLAELRIAGHKGGAIFDDPVSSLDHWRRIYVAERLVKEAANRQVVVLTHDTSFLGELRDAIEQASAAHSIQFLQWQGGRSGHVSNGLPWEHQGYKERIDFLEKGHKKLEKLPWPPYPSQDEIGQMRTQYSLMRSTIERVVQDLVFGGVIQRYRDWIRMDGIEKAVGFTNVEQAEISRLHKRCCNVTEAHDPASAKAAAVPSAVDLEADILALKQVIKTIVDRQKK